MAEVFTAPDVIHINVGTDDIEQGMRNHPYRCPIAIAVKRSVGIDGEVEVDGDGVRAVGHSYTLADAQRTFVQRYDKGKRVEPFSTDLRHDEDCFACSGCLCMNCTARRAREEAAS